MSALILRYRGTAARDGMTMVVHRPRHPSSPTHYTKAPACPLSFVDNIPSPAMFQSHAHRTSVHAPPHRYSQSTRPTSYAAPPPQQPAQLQHSTSTHSSHSLHRQHSQPAPVPDQQRLWGWFCQVDRDGSGEISVTELQTALVNGM